jgi:hypothetical protein
MEGYCSTGQSPQRAVVPMEEEEEEEEEEEFIQPFGIVSCLINKATLEHFQKELRQTRRHIGESTRKLNPTRTTTFRGH